MENETKDKFSSIACSYDLFPGKNKPVKLEDVLNLLAAGFLRGGFGFLKSSSAGEMIKGGGGTLNREIRVGVTHVS